MSTAYVDNAVLAMVLSASLFLLVLLDRERDLSAAAFLFGAACGVGLLVKMSFLPLFLPASLIVAWLAWRRHELSGAVAFAGGITVVIPNLLFNWVHRGSPFYPFEIVSFLPFNRQHSWILSKYGEGATPAELARAAKALVVNESPIDPFLNVGFLGVVLLVLGLVAATGLVRSRRLGWYLFWALSGAVVIVYTFFSPKNSSMFVLWTLTMGRLLVPGLSPILVLGGLTGLTQAAVEVDMSAFPFTEDDFVPVIACFR